MTLVRTSTLSFLLHLPRPCSKRAACLGSGVECFVDYSILPILVPLANVTARSLQMHLSEHRHGASCRKAASIRFLGEMDTVLLKATVPISTAATWDDKVQCYLAAIGSCCFACHLNVDMMLKEGREKE